MIIQGSNIPIRLNFSETMETYALSASLFDKNGNLLKHWTNDTATVSDTKVVLPLTQSETLSFPQGHSTIEFKWRNGDNVEFAKIIPEAIILRNDETLIGEDTAGTGESDHWIEVEVETGTIIEKGYSPYIGENGDWYEYSITTHAFIDTGVHAQGIQGETGPQGEKGEQGIKGDKGDKPIKGVDYFTEEDISEMEEAVSSGAIGTFNKNVTEKTEAFNSNATTKVTEYDNNAISKTTAFNNNATEKTTEFDEYVKTKVVISTLEEAKEYLELEV